MVVMQPNLANVIAVFAYALLFFFILGLFMRAWQIVGGAVKGLGQWRYRGVSAEASPSQMVRQQQGAPPAPTVQRKRRPPTDPVATTPKSHHKPTQATAVEETVRSTSSKDALVATVPELKSAELVYQGKLIRHGTERRTGGVSTPYDCYCVVISDPTANGGANQIWGTDLERAMRDSGAKPGDVIKVQMAGTTKVPFKKAGQTKFSEKKLWQITKVRN